MNRAFLVVGPPSSGTRLITRMILSAGVYGDGGHKQRLDQWIEPRDSGDPPGPPHGTDIVIRRSMPHGTEFPDLMSMVRRLYLEGFKPHLVVTSRDWNCMCQSINKCRYTDSHALALEWIRDAYTRIFATVLVSPTLQDQSGVPEGADPGDYVVPYTMVSYEAMTAHPVQYCAWLGKDLRLRFTSASCIDIVDGNTKYYE